MVAGADDWWRCAQIELSAAKVLKDAGKLNQAYFHAGQSVEFILKALILKRNNLRFWPDVYKGAKWHDIQICAREARLSNDLNNASALIKASWLTARDWKSNGRFPDLKQPQNDLIEIYFAVTREKDGVWKWLETIYLQ